MFGSARRKRCAVCRDVVDDERVEVQAMPYGRRVRCHRDCFEVWSAPYYRATYVSAPIPLELVAYEESLTEVRERP